jgi:hypothetical protein
LGSAIAARFCGWVESTLRQQGWPELSRNGRGLVRRTATFMYATRSSSPAGFRWRRSHACSRQLSTGRSTAWARRAPAMGHEAERYEATALTIRQRCGPPMKHRSGMTTTLCSLNQRSHELRQATDDSGLIGLGTFPCRNQFIRLEYNASHSLTATECHAEFPISIWVRLQVAHCADGTNEPTRRDCGWPKRFPCSSVTPLHRCSQNYGMIRKASIDPWTQIVLGPEIHAGLRSFATLQPCRVFVKDAVTF